MKFWNWGPTTIWHNIGSVTYFLSKSLHPNEHLLNYPFQISIEAGKKKIFCKNTVDHEHRTLPDFTLCLRKIGGDNEQLSVQTCSAQVPQHPQGTNTRRAHRFYRAHEDQRAQASARLKL